MSRKEGSFKLSSNIEPRAAAPLDARTVVPTLADLTASGAYPYPYVGMIVSVQDTGKAYILTASDTTVLANWKELGAGGGGGGSYTAGYGIDITNDIISANVDDESINVNTDNNIEITLKAKKKEIENKVRVKISEKEGDKANIGGVRVELLDLQTSIANRLNTDIKGEVTFALPEQAKGKYN